MSDDRIHEMIASLILGDATLFGQPITIAWPKGWPPGMTGDDVRAIARKWQPDAAAARGEWVRVTP